MHEFDPLIESRVAETIRRRTADPVPLRTRGTSLPERRRTSQRVARGLYRLADRLEG